jgi:uncharacterized lipoprotein YehR (DUF1307 family)
MNNLRKNIKSVIPIVTLVLAMLSLSGCGDNEMTKGITDTVKKSVAGELSKKGDEIKKQFDQIINMGTGKNQKEDGKGTAGTGKEKSENDSDKESKEKD